MQGQHLSLEDVSPELRQAIEAAGCAHGEDPVGGYYFATHSEGAGLLIMFVWGDKPDELSKEMLTEEPAGVRWRKAGLGGV